MNGENLYGEPHAGQRLTSLPANWPQINSILRYTAIYWIEKKKEKELGREKLLRP